MKFRAPSLRQSEKDKESLFYVGSLKNSPHLINKPEADGQCAHFTPSLLQCSVLRVFKVIYSYTEKKEV